MNVPSDALMDEIVVATLDRSKLAFELHPGTHNIRS